MEGEKRMRACRDGMGGRDRQVMGAWGRHSHQGNFSSTTAATPQGRHHGPGTRPLHRQWSTQSCRVLADVLLDFRQSATQAATFC